MSGPAHTSPAQASGLRMILVMAGVGLAASLALVSTFRLTAPRIAANRAAYLQASLSRVLPDATDFRAMVADDGAWREAADTDQGRRVFFAYRTDSLVGLAVEAAGQGYADIIRILYGFDPECGCVVAMAVLESKETPGLGDRIEKDPEFQANFDRLVVARNGEPIALRLVKPGQKQNDGEVDAISGATVSSQAITDILARSTAELVGAINRIGMPTYVPSDTLALAGRQTSTGRDVPPAIQP